MMWEEILWFGGFASHFQRFGVARGLYAQVGGTCAKAINIQVAKRDQGPGIWGQKISGGYRCGQ